MVMDINKDFGLQTRVQKLHLHHYHRQVISLANVWVFPILFGFMLAVLLCFEALAVEPIKSPNHEIRIKQGQDRLRDQVEPLLERQHIFLQKDYAVKTDASKRDDEHCFAIKTINVTGVTVFNAGDINQITRPYLNQCLGLGKINGSITALSNLYLDNGYVTSRAYINPQNLASSSLELIVVEGVVEALVEKPMGSSEKSTSAGITARQTGLAFPIKNNDLLNLRDLEQGLENINRLSQYQVTTELIPGDKQGGTVVLLSQNSQSNAYSGSIGFANTGVESTGKHQLDAAFLYGNLFGVNEQFIASGSTNVGGHTLDKALSQSFSLNASLPVGYWLFSLSNSFYRYEQSVVGSSIDFITRGSSVNSRISTEHMFYRDEASTLSFSVSFLKKQSKNYLEDVFLATSSHTLYLWEVASQYTHQHAMGNIRAGVTLSQSVPWFGAKQKVVAAESDFQFTKVQSNITNTFHFTVNEQPLRYQSALHLFYAPENILISEGLSVGGRYSVRGITDGSLYGSKGGYVRNDITLPLQQTYFFSQINIYAGVDIGLSNSPFDEANAYDWVAGSVVGLQALHEYLTFSLSYAKALHIPDTLQAGDQQFDFSLKYIF